MKVYSPIISRVSLTVRYTVPVWRQMTTIALKERLEPAVREKLETIAAKHITSENVQPSIPNSVLV